MTLINKFKKDKKFRLKVILIGLVLFFIFSGVGKKETTNEYCHSIVGSFISATNFKECVEEPGCYPQVNSAVNVPMVGADLLECVTFFLPFAIEAVTIDCVAEAEVGDFVVADYEGQGCPGDSRDVGNFCTHDVFKCLVAEPGSECVGTFEKTIGEFIQSLGISRGNCKNAAYIGLFGGIGIFVVAILAI